MSLDVLRVAILGRRGRRPLQLRQRRVGLAHLVAILGRRGRRPLLSSGVP